jgi:hypothetical protein
MARGVQEARTALIAPRNRRAPLIEAGATLSVWPALVMGLGRLLGQRSGCVFLPGPHTSAAELRERDPLPCGLPKQSEILQATTETTRRTDS